MVNIICKIFKIKKTFILLSLFVLSLCNSKSITVTTKKKEKITLNHKVNYNKSLKNSKKTIASKVVKNAIRFLGTKYKYGGITKKGMDCSGLVYKSFKLENITLPRSSFEQSKKGNRIILNKIKIGDLIFFKTNKSNRISHVGLVVNKNSNNIQFIHSTTSKGVIISSLKETYWSNTFALAKRLF